MPLTACFCNAADVFHDLALMIDQHVKELTYCSTLAVYCEAPCASHLTQLYITIRSFLTLWRDVTLSGYTIILWIFVHQGFFLLTCAQPENHSVPSYCICIYFPLCPILLILGDKMDQFSYCQKNLICVIGLAYCYDGITRKTCFRIVYGHIWSPHWIMCNGVSLMNYSKKISIDLLREKSVIKYTVSFSFVCSCALLLVSVCVCVCVLNVQSAKSNGKESSYLEGVTIPLCLMWWI